MDKFTRFNKNKIQDRQIDTLIGLSTGLIADNVVTQQEAETLHKWLVQNRHSNNPIIENLLNKVAEMLDDGFLDNEESSELLELLKNITGDASDFGELAKTSKLPLDEPSPAITFSGSTFLFTGTFAFGIRKDCHAVTENLGGIISNGVNKKLNYLVIGSYVTDSWAHENFGRKIEKAMAYRVTTPSLKIISEEHWANAAGI